MDDWIEIQRDERHIKRERAKARELRKTPYFQNLLRQGICHYCNEKIPAGGADARPPRSGRARRQKHPRESRHLLPLLQSGEEVPHPRRTPVASTGKRRLRKRRRRRRQRAGIELIKPLGRKPPAGGRPARPRPCRTCRCTVGRPANRRSAESPAGGRKYPPESPRDAPSAYRW